MKSAYLLHFEHQFVEIFWEEQEQERFRGWNKVWRLNLTAKFLVFIWKVIHRILQVKVGLIKHGVQVTANCPFCEQEESIEHLFFQCSFAKRVWRASFLGLDFDQGTPVGLVDWFLKWFAEVSSVEVIEESIVLMWSI